MTPKITWIGLGVMGFPMAGHLSSAGYSMTVYNRTTEKALDWVKQYSGNYITTPKDAAFGADIVISCVGNDNDLREITLGEQGAFHSMSEGAIFIDHTTTSANIARELNEEANHLGIQFVDAPVSGGQVGAETGKLTVMCGGGNNTFDEVTSIINNYSSSCKLMGEAGAGQLTKMVNQICIAGLLQGLSEGLNFAENAGLDGKAVLDVISKGAAGSWQMENRGKTMIDDQFDFGFAVDWMNKDLQICLDEAHRNKSKLTITTLINEFYKDIQKAGGGRWDTSSLIRRLNGNLKT